MARNLKKEQHIMNSTDAYALWTQYDIDARAEDEGGPVAVYPCTKQPDDPCQYIDTADHGWGKCKACGYVAHDIPQDSDEPHSELCCGSTVCLATDSGLCITHDRHEDEKPSAYVDAILNLPINVHN